MYARKIKLGVIAVAAEVIVKVLSGAILIIFIIDAYCPSSSYMLITLENYTKQNTPSCLLNAQKII